MVFHQQIACASKDLLLLPEVLAELLPDGRLEADGNSVPAVFFAEFISAAPHMVNAALRDEWANKKDAVNK